jgi:vancomycin resistance protein YoaR
MPTEASPPAAPESAALIAVRSAVPPATAPDASPLPAATEAVPPAAPRLAADEASDQQSEAHGADLPKRRGPLRFVLGFVFGLLAVFALAVGGLSAFEQQFSGRILPGVHVGDVDVSGLTSSQAAARLADAYGSLGEGTIVLAAADLRVSMPLAELRRPDVELMASGAMAVGREGSLLERVIVNAKTAVRGVVLAPQVIVDEDALERAVARFAASVDRAPVDARVEGDADAFRLIEGTVGRVTDWRGLLSRALDAARQFDLPLETVVEAEVTTVQPVVSTQEATAAVEKANRMVGDITVRDTAKTWTLPAALVRSWIDFEPTGDGLYRPVPRPDRLDAQLAEMAAAIQSQPVNAAYLFDRSGKIVGASEGRDGRSLDGPATVEEIADLLVQRGEGAAVTEMTPVVAVVKPQITTEQASATAPLMKKVSEWQTYFPISDRNGFGANIWIPAMDIDGYVVAPGAVFDFWKAIGPVTRARGYRDGGAIINGKTEPQGALAGGICSTSTTLFNAAMRAGLQMMARRNHYYYISRYPLGLDATVFQSSSGSIQTMSFRNDTGSPILIRAYKIRKGSAGYVKFELYGVPTGRTVTIGPEVIKNVRRAADRIQHTSTLAAGRSQRIESPADGKDVWRTITVKEASGAVIRSTTYYSHYARVDGVTLVGTRGAETTGSPPEPSPEASPAAG